MCVKICITKWEAGAENWLGSVRTENAIQHNTHQVHKCLVEKEESAS